MPKNTQYPSTPEINNKPVSRQRKLQLRANLAGKCGICLVNPLSELYHKSNRCDECRMKDLVRRGKSKNPQPYRLRPRCYEILEVVKNTPLDKLKDRKQLALLAKELKCPVGYINFLRRRKLGVKFNRGRPRK